ncbi:MAG: AgmX/PglI C-terminal domain-containing protein [Deltaproteobacteria bacterium]|nr:AgmX/PglI C-terminal domain-containing protein [Deltaproteobacteria bacterium]
MKADHRPDVGPTRLAAPLHLLAVLVAGCGAATPAGGSAGTDPGAGSPAEAASVRPPYVPVDLGDRTLLTQPAAEPDPDPGLPYLAAADDRVPGEDAVPEPRAPRPRSAGGADGGLEPEQVRDVVHDELPRFRHCFERLRQGNPNATEARVTVRFTIATGGSVSDAEVASAVPDDDDLASCVLTLVRALDFPRSSAATTTTYPFDFRVTDGDD